MKEEKIGILTGGGDCPGLNSAIKWVVKTATDERLSLKRERFFKVFGIHEGWKGLTDLDTQLGGNIDQFIEELDESKVRTWDRLGGTMLGTSRTNPYSQKKDRSKEVIQNIKNLGLDYLIAIGGDDTLSVAYNLGKAGIKVIGIPKTIDGDLTGTDYSLGFESAVQVIVVEIDRLRTTAGSHARTFIVETMGRHAGWLALEGGKAGGAFIILIPEYPFDINKINQLLKSRKERGVRYSIIVVAEGAKPAEGTLVYRDYQEDEFGHKTLGGIGKWVSDKISEGAGLETRHIVLSHLQRGGAPSAYDRRMGREFGIAAVDLLLAGKFGTMVNYKNGRVGFINLEDLTGKPHLVDIEKYYDTERYNGQREGVIDIKAEM
jgi:phosphofructokinase-like protein